MRCRVVLHKRGIKNEFLHVTLDLVNQATPNFCICYPMNAKKDRIDSVGATLLIGFSALLGLNQVLIKIVNDGIAPIFQAGLRSACAFFVVLIVARLLGRRLSVTDGSLVPGVVVGALFAFEFMLLFQALDFISVSRASILFYTMPFWVTLAAHVLVPGEKITTLKSIGLLFALIGVALTLRFNSSGGSSLLGDIFCLVAASAWAAIAVITRTTKLQRACPEMQLLYQLGVSAPLLIFAAILSGGFLREPTAITWSVFAFQVIVVVSIGFLTWFWVLSIYPIANMSVFSFLAPGFGVFFGWLVLDEKITLSILLALIFIAIGIALVNWRPLPKRRPN